MASTINASNSGFGGIVSTGDSSGQMQLQTAGTTAVTLDTSQNATFAGKITSAGSLTLASNGSTTAITIDTSQNVAFAKGFTVGATAAPTFSSAMSTTQTITSSTFTKVNFDTKTWDTNSNYNTSTYRFTPTVAGYYQVSCSIDAGASTGATRVLPAIYKNGSGYRYGGNLGTSSSNSFSSVCSSIVYCNGSTDYIECYGYIIASTAIISPSGGTWFDACLVRSA